MSSLAWSRFRGATLRVAVLLPLALLPGCTDSETLGVENGPVEIIDEMTAHDGKVCPKRLPPSVEPHGFGTSNSAASPPSLMEPDAAWVCKYNPVDSVAAVGNVLGYVWVRAGQALPVDAAQLPALARDLAMLAPAAKERSCTDDLGPRWMLVYSHSKDLTGVVVDDFGCQQVRLTDDPFSTEPGAASQGGTVPGVLIGPASLLATIKTVYIS